MGEANRNSAPTPWEAANGEVVPTHVLRDSDTRAIPVTAPASLTAPGSNAAPHSDLFDTVVLPVVQPRPSPALTARRQPERAQMLVRRPTAPRRPRAPLALRVFVLVLFLLFLATTGALVTARVHPSTFDSLRQSYVFPPTKGGTPRPPVKAATGTHAALVSSTSSAITYSVPASSYSIVVTISHPCWLVVRSPAGGSVPLFAKTIVPTVSPLRVPVSGSSSIMIAARATSLSIVHGSMVLDTVANPRVGIEYTFVPTA